MCPNKSANPGQEAVNLSYQQQATYNKELGRLQTALKSQNLLDGLQQEIKDLLSVEAESEQDHGLQQMALQERKILESQASTTVRDLGWNMIQRHFHD